MNTITSDAERLAFEDAVTKLGFAADLDFTPTNLPPPARFYMHIRTNQLLRTWQAARSSPGAGLRLVPEGWKLVPVEPTPEMIAAATVAVLPDASADDFELARKAARIVLAHPNAPPGVSLEAIAAAMATIIPAHKAMLIAAPDASLAVRVDGISEGGARHVLHVEGVAQLRDGVMGIVVQLPTAAPSIPDAEGQVRQGLNEAEIECGFCDNRHTREAVAACPHGEFCGAGKGKS